jgi:hypothetical protein
MRRRFFQLAACLTPVLMIGCGGDPAIAPVDPVSAVESIQAARQGDHVTLDFALSASSNRVMIERVTQETGKLELLHVFVDDNRLKWSVIDSSLYSGRSYRYRVIPSRISSDWVGVDMPGSDLSVNANPGFGVVYVAWDPMPREVASYQVVRTSDDGEVVLWEGPGTLFAKTEIGLDAATSYEYQIRSNLVDGTALLSRRSSARLLDLTIEGAPTLPGYKSSGHIVNVENGLPVMAFTGPNGIAIGSMPSDRTFHLTPIFDDPHARFEPGTTSALWVPPDQGITRLVHYVVAGLTRDSVVVRGYTSAGFLRHQSWPRRSSETQTYLAVGSSPQPKRDFLFVATEERVWEVTTSVRDAQAFAIPFGSASDLAVTDGNLHVVSSEPPGIHRVSFDLLPGAQGTWEIGAEEWESVALPSDLRPVSAAAVPTRRGRLWVLDGNQSRLYNMDSAGETVSFVTLEDGAAIRRVFTTRSGFGGVVLTKRDGSIQVFEP